MYCIHLYTIYRNHHWSYKSMGPWGFLKSFWSPTGRRCVSQYQATERTSDWAPRSCVKDCIICSKALLAADNGGKWLHPMDSSWRKPGGFLMFDGRREVSLVLKIAFCWGNDGFYLVEPPSLSWNDWNVNMLGVFATVTLGFCLGTMSKAAVVGLRDGLPGTRKKVDLWRGKWWFQTPKQGFKKHEWFLEVQFQL